MESKPNVIFQNECPGGLLEEQWAWGQRRRLDPGSVPPGTQSPEQQGVPTFIKERRQLLNCVGNSDFKELLFFYFLNLFLEHSFFKFTYFNWRIITLQYGDGFFAIHQHESTIGTHVCY